MLSLTSFKKIKHVMIFDDVLTSTKKMGHCAVGTGCAEPAEFVKAKLIMMHKTLPFRNPLFRNYTDGHSAICCYTYIVCVCFFYSFAQSVLIYAFYDCFHEINLSSRLL